MIMKTRLFNLAASLALATGAAAQSDVVANFDMTLATDNTIAESVTGQTFAVNHNIAPENVAGAAGQALRLDGYSTYVSAAINAAALSTSALSVSLWCAPETYPMMNAAEAENAETWIAGNLDEAAHTGFAFTITSQGDYGFKCYTDGWAVTLTAPDKMPCYEWSHLVATIDADGGTATLYRNGQPVATSRCMSPVNTGGDAFMIGKSTADRAFDQYLLNTFNGLIDDITIYNRVLTQAEAALPEAGHAADLSVPASRHAADLLRPAFHGMPATAWTNECHGMAYSDGRYHVFFQKNANGPYMARLHWGHIYSENLYKWHEDRIAIAPGEAYDIKGCWSGTVFSDEELTGGRPAIIYTGVDNARASIDMALPDDETLTTWTKSADNPLIAGRPEGLSDDFRDPYFFTSGGKKYIIVGSSKNGIGTTTLHEYLPQTGTWSNDGRTFFSGASASTAGTFWEMPNITPMGDKWLFTATPLNTSQGVETIYWTGDIDADGRFVPTSSAVTAPAKLELDGFSHDGYGLLSPTIFNHDGKTLLMGIVPDKLPSADNYRMGWAHCYSLPREVSLTADGLLAQRPYSGLAAMRTAKSFTRGGFTLDGSLSLTPVSGRQIELLGEFRVGQSPFGFNFYKDGDRQARLSYDPLTNVLSLDVTSVDRLVNDGGTFDGVYRSELPRRIAAGEEMRMHVYVDHSIVDIFINDTWACSVRLFATSPSAVGAEAFADGATQVDSLSAWNLDPDAATDSGIARPAADTAAGGATISGRGNSVVWTAGSGDGRLSVYDVAGRLIAAVGVKAGRGGSLGVARGGLCIAELTTQAGTVRRKLMLK